MQFERCSLKTLTAVEADPGRSNQHEFQGVSALRSIFGNERLLVPAVFSLRGNNESYRVNLTWYDARENIAHRSPEFRLYFQSNPVMECAQEGDSIIIGVVNGAVYCELIKVGNSGYQASNHWINLV